MIAQRLEQPHARVDQLHSLSKGVRREQYIPAVSEDLGMPSRREELASKVPTRARLPCESTVARQVERGWSPTINPDPCDERGHRVRRSMFEDSLRRGVLARRECNSMAAWRREKATPGPPHGGRRGRRTYLPGRHCPGRWPGQPSPLSHASRAPPRAAQRLRVSGGGQTRPSGSTSCMMPAVRCSRIVSARPPAPSLGEGDQPSAKTRELVASEMLDDLLQRLI